jgi:hypothetical protein
MSLQSRLKEAEEKLNMKMGQAVYICFDKNKKFVDRNGAKFVLPKRFDKEKDCVVTLDWELRA